MYSTCSLSLLENEMVISHVLKKFGDAVETVPIPLSVTERVPAIMEWNGRSFHDGVSNAVRLIPSARMEGFFICKLLKLNSTLGERR